MGSPIQFIHYFSLTRKPFKKKIFIPKLNKNSPRFLLFFPSPPDIITRPQVTRMTFEEFAKSVNEAVKNSKPTILIYPLCFITFRPFFRRDEEIARKMPSKFFPNYEILGIIPGHIAHRIPRLFPPCCPRCIVKHGSMPADKRKFGIQSSFDGLGARRPNLWPVYVTGDARKRFSNGKFMETGTGYNSLLVTSLPGNGRKSKMFHVRAIQTSAI